MDRTAAPALAGHLGAPAPSPVAASGSAAADAHAGSDLGDLARFDGACAEEVLAWGLERFHPRMAVVTGMQAEGMVLVDMAHRIAPDVRIFTIDTGRLPEETHRLIDEVRGRYGVVVEVLFPETTHVETLVERHGMNLFRHDVALRRLCCYVRKVLPLDGALARVDAWATGVRRSQTEQRARAGKAEIDAAHGGIVKLNPLADWSREQVWDYIRANKVPHSELYEQGYTSIGCAPCTRAPLGGETERAGRWWWEDGAAKECGIHGASPDERFEQEKAWLSLNGK